MKIYSDYIERQNLIEELIGIEDVYIDESGIREFAPKHKQGKRAELFGYELFLEGYGERHKRARNGQGGKAATWDDYGVWFARLYEIDPDAKISYYKNRNDFVSWTGHYGVRGGEAPWLHVDVSRPFQWPLVRELVK